MTKQDISKELQTTCAPWRLGCSWPARGFASCRRHGHTSWPLGLGQRKKQRPPRERETDRKEGRNREREREGMSGGKGGQQLDSPSELKPELIPSALFNATPRLRALCGGTILRQRQRMLAGTSLGSTLEFGFVNTLSLDLSFRISLVFMGWVGCRYDFISNTHSLYRPFYRSKACKYINSLHKGSTVYMTLNKLYAWTAVWIWTAVRGSVSARDVEGNRGKSEAECHRSCPFLNLHSKWQALHCGCRKRPDGHENRERERERERSRCGV